MDPAHRAGLNEENGSAVQPAASLETEKTINLSPSEAEGSLLRRVEPKYPDEARLQHVQGTVILDVQIGTDGKVQDVQVVSGPPLLAQASTDAIKQWRFKTPRVNGHPAEMQTQVKLNFRLPPGH
jgi:protein TonB